jgi:hypothetical protein
MTPSSEVTRVNTKCEKLLNEVSSGYQCLYPLLAAIAVANDVTLVTHITREFSRIKELNIEDWELDIP